MDVFEAVQKRRSVRAYESTPVPTKKLKRILEAGRLAPSAGNTQPWHFIVVTDAEMRKKLAESRSAKFLDGSPVVIVGCGNQKASPKWYKVDVAIALQNMVLTATSEGLGSCWIGAFYEDQLREMLKIPEEFTIVALLAVGYLAEKLSIQEKVSEPIRRKPLEEIVSFESYGRMEAK